MLELKDIKKDYPVADGVVHALKGISVKFRKNEFVSILGASGCGKTTLLNIIGGLDKYTSGDLIIEGKSTKEYKDVDWDTYRNHSIGFIFQSYHLIPHQTILQNVELALLIAGVSKEERRERAIKALERVGLGDKIHNRPNQLSGGQAQRVAIARALINDPEIVLADEPTGALDSKTSVQIMELLKEISKDRLVIMVTHNPELAERYSTRIIRLLDGEIMSDSMPYDGEVEVKAEVVESVEKEDNGEISEGVAEKKTNKGKKKKTSMSFGMAFSLSLKNLLSKRKRTAMVSVAGSIGIIGVSMVLAISSGVTGYIDDMENDMLSGYPLSVTRTAIDYEELLNLASSNDVEVDPSRLDDKVYVDSLLETLMKLNNSQTTNNITMAYKYYVDQMPTEYYNAIKYSYNFDMSNYIYTDFRVSDSLPQYTENVSVTAIRSKYTSVLETQPAYADYANMISTISSFSEMPDNVDYVLSQYDILATYDGKTKNLSGSELEDLFESKDSLIMVINENSFADLDFGQYGYMTEEEFLNFALKAEGNSPYDQSVIDSYNGKDFDFFVGEDAKTFKWYPNDTIYTKPAADETFEIETSTGTQVIPGAILPFKYNASSEGFSDKDSVDLKVKVILQKKEGISYGCLSSGIYHTKALTDYTLEKNVESNIVKFIKANGDELPFLPYKYDYHYRDFNGDNPFEYKSASSVSFIFKASSDNMISSIMGGSSTADLLKVDSHIVGGNYVPTAIYIYPVDFKAKDSVTVYLDGWNNLCAEGTDDKPYEYTYLDENGDENTAYLTETDKINYTDTVGLIITMVNTMIQMVTIALVAFTALSLVVSTVMVGIITYVSVVERIKEIGILRSVGARKKDIKRLFNAETFIIGLAAGLVGIIITYILSLIINIIVGVIAGVFTICALPWWQAIIMVLVSVGLTLISGLIPAAAAAKKDPVVALRTE